MCIRDRARTLRTPSAIKTDTFFGGKVELLKFQLPADSPLSGKTLMELPSVTKAKVLVCAVERGEQEILSLIHIYTDAEYAAARP